MANQRALQLTRDDSLYLRNLQTNLVIVLHALTLLFWHFISPPAYYLDKYEPSSSSTKELHGLTKGVLIKVVLISYSVIRYKQK